MKSWLTLSVFLLAGTIIFLSSCGEKHRYVLIETDYGNMKVMLYNTTPVHRDNFVKLVKEGFYDDLLFHRIINGFMIQGGDPESKDAPANKRLGGGGPGYQLQAEIGAPHLKGALAAARTNNPEKKSSGSQFYIVHGRTWSDAELDNFQNQKNLVYNEEQRRIYREVGGYPPLDGEYTVFGEVVEGLDVVDKIAAVQTQPGDRPVEDVKMKIRITRK